jgi:tetratricopeptide (TPR) repeat protein
MKNVQDEQYGSTIFSATLIALMAVFAAWFFGPVEAQAQTASGLINRIGDTTHLEFRGRQQWNYDSPKRDGDKISILLPAFDDRTVLELQTWSCPFIKKITVNKNAPDGKYEVSFQLAAHDIEVFDYLTDQPASLIFDFYKANPKSTPKATSEAEANPNPEVRNTQPSLAEADAAKTGAAKTGAAKTSAKAKKNDRRPASTEFLKIEPKIDNHIAGLNAATPVETAEQVANIRFEKGIFDGEDPNYDRFRIKDYQIHEEAIIASQQNIYIRFPMLPLKLNRFQELADNPPIYEIKADDDPAIAQQNKEARFLLTLFEKRRWGAFFETYNYFIKKYPQTKYDEIVKNLAAEAHMHLYDRDGDPKDREAYRGLYHYLVERYPDSVLTQRNALLLGYSYLASSEGADALRLMMLFKKKYPNSPEADKVKMAIAEADVMMGRPEDALKTYEDIIKNPHDKNSVVEAEFRRGDVYFGEKDYKKALETYEAVQKKYPDFNAVYPNAQYNASESQFWLGQHKASLQSFIEFVKLYPNHEYGGYALTRIGELLEILGADQNRVLGALREAYFRYPNNPGSAVARIRMLSQGLKDMSEREKKLAIEEIDRISEKSTLPQIDEFTTLLKAAGLSRRGEYKDSLDLLLGYYQAHPGTAKLDVFRGRILRNISDVLKEQVEKHNYIDALNFFGKYSTTWLKNSNRVDTAYFQAIAFEQAGVPKEAETAYKKILAQLKSMAGTKEEKERKVYEHMPTQSQLNLRLAAVAASERRYQEAFNYLKNIKTELEPGEEIERVQIGATVADQMGDVKSAITNLQKLCQAYADDPDLAAQMVKPELQLSRLYLKEKNFGLADTNLKKVEKLKNGAETVSDDDWAQALEVRGDLLLAQGQKLAAVEAFSKLLDAYEASRPLASVRYKAGQILFDEGDIKGAEKMWSNFDAKTGEFYRQLAQEKLQQAQWQDTYKKYIQRIPAAESLK